MQTLASPSFKSRFLKVKNGEAKGAQVEEGSSSSNCYYDVFLSFRGEDTRTNFTGHLYEALDQHGFHTFKDDKKSDKGESLKSELEKAISHSKASIIVLSDNYATSRWCLDELVMILEKKRNSKHVVLPLFYNVDPSDIRNQEGTTRHAFTKYEKQVEEETNHVLKMKLMERNSKWRSALTEVADLIGLDLHNQANGDEADFIKIIIKEVRKNLRLKTMDVAPYEIGMESRAKDTNMWLKDGSTCVSMRALCGPPGVGKTTIAKFVYNENYAAFDASSFLENISRRVSTEPSNNLVRLQRHLLSDICRSEYGRINNIGEGINQIQKVLRGKRVLLVLDDVNDSTVEDRNLIYSIIGKQDWLFPGSKVIITTRDDKFLQPHHQIFRVERLGEAESMKLFSWYAFGVDTPIQSYTKQTKRVLKYCQGFPLALEMLGSSLYGKDEDEWLWQLTELETIMALNHCEVIPLLPVILGSFFCGKNEDLWICVLEQAQLAEDEDEELYPNIGEVLKDAIIEKAEEIVDDVLNEVIKETKKWGEEIEEEIEELKEAFEEKAEEIIDDVLRGVKKWGEEIEEELNEESEDEWSVVDNIIDWFS